MVDTGRHICTSGNGTADATNGYAALRLQAGEPDSGSDIAAMLPRGA
ncbi:MAG: hypothetical protein KME30_31540 [Iphinoe sp. HA4291-MV1]|nr:hypothetical protein [Iphinoe sp. HA4291-MV1]